MSVRSLVAAVALVAGVAGVVLLGAAVIPPVPVSRADQVEAIAAELRCPTCQALSVADSRSEPAAEIRRQIAALLAEGRTPEEVKRHFVDRYGEWILLSPTSPAVWLIPGTVTLLAVVALAVWLGRARPDRQAAPLPSVASDERYRERVRDELEALDA